MSPSRIEEVARLEHAGGLGQVQHVDKALVAHQIIAAKHGVGNFCRFIAEHENPGRVGQRGAETADNGDGLYRAKGLSFKGNPALRPGGTQGHEGAGVFLDHDLVARTQGDIKRGVGVEIFQPDLAGLPATRDPDDRGFGVDGHAARLGHHGGQGAGGAFNGIDALRGYGARQGDGGAIARQTLNPRSAGLGFGCRACA